MLRTTAKLHDARDDIPDSTFDSEPLPETTHSTTEPTQAVISEIPTEIRSPISAPIATAIISVSVVVFVMALTFGFWLYCRRKGGIRAYMNNPTINSSRRRGDAESDVLPVAPSRKQAHPNEHQKADCMEMENPFSEPSSNTQSRINTPCSYQFESRGVSQGR